MDKLSKIANYSMEQLSLDHSGHGVDHTKRVVELARQILETEPQADSFITIASAYLHDTIDDKVVEDEEQAKAHLKGFLTSIELAESEIQHIFHIIENMSFSKGLSGQVDLSLEGKIVQDADRLEALGAIGILRTAYYGGFHGHPIFDPAIQPINYTKKQDYRKGSTVINHFYEKLLLLSDQMNTRYAKQEAKRREAFMRDFLKEFYEEWFVEVDSPDRQTWRDR
ncbi:HD domain-containing protein [Candidatus Enterococcus mangumiae]|uniref:HD/PDEase domain-containing protein n=1 Tax=Candidatus Enterococcus mangumiae TaxID=2230878 RepID=A0ABZ2T0R0_9ENTE|nr:HD domain-containing protein [Enterococcus sp. DIV1094]